MIPENEIIPTLPPQPKRYLLLIGICILLISFFLFPIGTRLILNHAFGIEHNSLVAIWVSRFIYWICLLLAIGYSVKIEKRKLLIWEEKKYKWPFYPISVIAIFGALFAGLLFIGLSLKAAGFKNDSEVFEKMMGIFRSNKLLLIFTALTAGFVEELTFRGYILTRLEALTKSPVIAILLSSVMFGLMHYGYGTFIQVAGPFLIGLVLAFHYYEFRNIKVLIFCHVAWDLLAIYIKL